MRLTALAMVPLAAAVLLASPLMGQEAGIDSLPRLAVGEYVPNVVPGFGRADITGLTPTDSMVNPGVQEGVLVSYSGSVSSQIFARGIQGYGLSMDVLRFDTEPHARASVSEDFANMGAVDTTAVAGLQVVRTQQRNCYGGQGSGTYWLGYRQGTLAIRIAVDQAGDCSALDWDSMEKDAVKTLRQMVESARP